MKKLYNFNPKIIATSLLSLYFSSIHGTAQAIIWPQLDNVAKPAHQRIISSIFGRENESYKGGQFKGNFFIAQGTEDLNQRNAAFIADLPQLRTLLNEGHKIEIYSHANAQRVAAFRKKALYKIAVDGQERPYDFILGNKENISNFTPFVINQLAHSNQELRIEGIGTVYLGHGARPQGRQLGNGVSDTRISALMAQHRDNPVLNKAFKMIEACDYASAHDRKNLLEIIRHPQDRPLRVHSVIELMKQDLALVKKAQNIVKQRASNYTTPFKDQLKEIVNFHGLDHAIALIQRYPELMEGKIPEHLTHASGGQSLTLRTALFYIAIAKCQLSGQNFVDVAAKLATFYPGNLPSNQSVASLLKQTHLYHNGTFFSPANGYVKNADRGITPSINTQGLNLVREPGRTLSNPEMFFTDCSGFITNVLRYLNPSNQWLQNNRFMSNHLAAAYDILANRAQGTSHGLYDIHGHKQRSLTSFEKNQLNNSRVSHLTSLFTPVMDPVHNIKPGDVIVTRHPTGAVEGHVMIVVDRNPHNPDEITIVEMTRADVGGNRHGYNWRTISLSQPGNGKFCRVLRMKQE